MLPGQFSLKLNSILGLNSGSRYSISRSTMYAAFQNGIDLN